MGGMIAQTMAIEHPERVRSLVSIMSTTGSRWIGLPELQDLRRPARQRRRTSREAVDRARDQDLPRDRLARLPVRRGARSASSPVAPSTAATAPPASPASCTRSPPPATAPAACASLDLPATVIHGNRDPLVRPSGGRATAKAIPGARLKMIDGMGHDLPRAALADLRRRDRRQRRARHRGAEPASRLSVAPSPVARAMRLKGVEPPRALAHTDLNRARLPVPPQPREQAIYRLRARARPPAARP